MADNEMKGVVLAGGLGTRLKTLTRITNKHLLPIYDRPLVFYPIQILINAGIRDILIITGGESAGHFLRLLQNGKDFGLDRLNYAYQEGPGGIAQALSLAEPFAEGKRVMVVLGDQIIEKNVCEAVEAFRRQPSGARIILKEVDNPEHFGVPTIEDGRITRIIEKPEDPDSRFAVIGIYMYDRRVFDIIRTLKPSPRGQLEITDVNNRYLDWGELHYNVLDGWWKDPGTSPDSLLDAGNLVRETGANRLD